MHYGKQVHQLSINNSLQLTVVPWHWLSTVGRRAFAVHSPMVWNSLPDNLRPPQDYVSFKHGLKTGVLWQLRCINLRIPYRTTAWQWRKQSKPLQSIFIELLTHYISLLQTVLFPGIIYWKPVKVITHTETKTKQSLPFFAQYIQYVTELKIRKPDAEWV